MLCGQVGSPSCSTYSICQPADPTSCYRALFPSSDPARVASASSFCQTYTKTVATATTGFPTRYTSACGASPSKYSSACSCAPTTTVTPPPSSTLVPSKTSTASTSTRTYGPCESNPSKVIQNGDFECGEYPWRAYVTHNTTYSITDVGAESGTHAFRVEQHGPVDQLYAFPQARLWQDGGGSKGGTLSFYTWQSYEAGFIGVMIFAGDGSRAAIYDTDARQDGGGVWIANSFDFSTVPEWYQVVFEFFTDGYTPEAPTGDGTVQMLDNITFVPAK